MIWCINKVRYPASLISSKSSLHVMFYGGHNFIFDVLLQGAATCGLWARSGLQYYWNCPVQLEGLPVPAPLCLHWGWAAKSCAGAGHLQIVSTWPPLLPSLCPFPPPPPQISSLVVVSGCACATTGWGGSRIRKQWQQDGCSLQMPIQLLTNWKLRPTAAREWQGWKKQQRCGHSS